MLNVQNLGNFSVTIQIPVTIRRLTDAKSYECKDWRKGFTIMWPLVCHQKTQTGVKVYACTECEKAFPLKELIQVLRPITIQNIGKVSPSQNLHE